MTSYAVKAPPFEIAIALPASESVEFYGSRPNLYLNIQEPTAYNEFDQIEAIHKYFDYDKRLFGQIDGTLGVRVAFHRVSDGTTLDITESSALRSYIDSDLHLYYDAWNAKVQAAGSRGGRLVKLPSEYVAVTVNGVEGLRYELIGGSRNTVTVFSLSAIHYVSVDFEFIDNSHGKKSKWSEKALKDAERIMSTLKIRRVDPNLAAP